MTRITCVTTAVLVLLTALAHTPAAAADPPVNFTNEIVLPAISQPMSMRFLPDGRLLVLLRGGEILITDPGETPASSAAYMTVTNLNDSQERGAYDIAIDPNFNVNGLFYLYYTPDSPSLPRISSFFHQENLGGLTSTGDITSEVVLWEDTDGYTACCHYGGGLDIGPEGRLWLTTGDKFSGTNSQDLTRAAGSVLRINTDGSIPADNFGMSDGVGGIHDAIFAYGLRNPFRARWDFVDERMFIGEVGGNDVWKSSEDLHVVTLADSATNFGWPFCEGACDDPNFPTCDCNNHTEALFSYPHFGSGASITGGVVYRGSDFPAPYQGAYFFGDYVRGWIHYLTFDGSGDPSGGTPTEGFGFDESVGPVVGIEQGPDGALYYVTIFGSATNPAMGDLGRYVYDDGNQAPVITSAAATPDSGIAPLGVTFTATATDGEGDPLTYLWVFGDGDSLSGNVVNDTVPDAVHNYTANGVYQAQLFVSDASHTTASSLVTVTLGIAPTVTIDMPTDGSLFQAGDMINYSATANDTDGSLDGSNYAWTVRFKHDEHFHPDVSGVPGQSGSFEIPMSGHEFGGDTGYTIDVLVTDDDGLTAADTVTIVPDQVDLTFETVPSGLVVFVDGIPHVTPYVHETLIGFEHTVSVNTTQCLEDSAYNFNNWSDAGAATHVISAPGMNATYTASFDVAGACTLTVQGGLVMRLKGDVGVSASADTVSMWADQSASNNSMTSVSNDGPIRLAGALNGHDVLSFDGIDDGMSRSGFTGLPTGSDDRSVFMVVKYESALWAGFTWGTAACNQTFGLTNSAGGNLGVQGWCGPSDFESNTFANGAGWMIQSVVMGANSFVHYQNGNMIDAGSHVFNTGTSDVRLGVEQNNNRHLQAQFAEILVYDRAVSEMERQQIEAYLRNEYFGAPQSWSIAITEPGDSEFIADDEISVSWVAGGDLSAAEHVHVILDTMPHVTVHQFNGTHVFTDVETGPHRIIVELATSGHAVLAADTVDVVLDAACALVDSGLVLHLESDAGVGTTGNQVIWWLDQTNNQNDLLAAGDPAYLTSGGPNNQPYLSFDGTDDVMDREHVNDPIVGLPQGAADRTVFFVVRYDGLGYGGFTYGSSACNESFGLVVSPNAKLTLQGFCLPNDFETVFTGTGVGWTMQSVVLAANTFSHYKDGLLIDSQAHVFATTMERMTLGGELDGDPLIGMDAAAILVYDRALDAAERQQVEWYLQQKYFGVPCPFNTAPVAVDDNFAAATGATVMLDVLANDNDPDGFLDPASVTVVVSPVTGGLSVLPSGEISYTHSGIPSDVDSFTYVVNDTEGASSNEAIVYIGNDPPTGIDSLKPQRFALYQNSPNPFNPTTTIRYDMPSAAHVRVRIYNVQGKLVRDLVNESRPAGRHAAVWDGQSDRGNPVASGVYIAVLQAGTYRHAVRMVLLK